MSAKELADDLCDLLLDRIGLQDTVDAMQGAPLRSSDLPGSCSNSRASFPWHS